MQAFRVLRRPPRTSTLAVALCAALTMMSANAQQPAPLNVQGEHRTAAVLPGDDFYTFANGQWLAATEIPADRSGWSAGQALVEDTSQRILQLIDAAGRQPGAGDAKKVAAYYGALMDEAGIEGRGTAPLRPALSRIAAIRDRAGLTQALGASLRADVDPLNATDFATENLFGVWIAQGFKDPDNYVPYLLQGGLGMPDRAFYLEENERMSRLRTAYQAHIAAMLKLAGFTEPEARAARVFELERKLAQAHGLREESSDVQKANNVWTDKDFAARAPGLDWKAFFQAAGLGKQRKFIVYHPRAITGAAALVAEMPVQTWQDWLAFHTINQHAGALPKAFVDQRFDFYGRTLSGTPQLSPRWKRSLAALNAAMPEAVGKMYVDKYFPPEAKARVQQMVTNIVNAFHQRIDRLDWMAPATKREAHAKLDVLYVGVGYPEKWTTYAGLEVKPDDAFGNAYRAAQYHYKLELAKLGTKVDPKEWSMPPQLVNAVNMPMQNALNFPAAILQPPFFDPNGSDAVNYGAIGSVIGHEISHSFDNIGAEFDSKGRLRDWWTKADRDHFAKAAQVLVAQYSAYEAFPDLKLNGQLTLAENLADLAGLAAALDAYHASLGGKGSPESDRQFFLGYAQAWRDKSREASLRNQVATDEHAPAQWRTYTVRNLDDWYQAFDVQPGQKLYLAPEARVRVW
ncbi:M13 family metallopeptidase [Pseudoduganella umbonata]|uniref:Endothelin-converting enzyme/putative endopeptidase n=1 Tax=Pseudoduganella umbonata TaxID=864828 RepID=A0A4P8HV10_9BURK|nr:M13 family metallopeptidase [Pseudoduganella umbonata]MBB3223328.1 endothelin-converting enzyme/putative endopeptidase [Pseudoduganella umbonata]QCP13763.1 M13 family metallopeptidase [Pseudoduganella umbonata]